MLKHKYALIKKLAIIIFVMPILAQSKNIPTTSPYQQFAQLEQAAHGHLAIYAFNSANQQQVNYRSNEPFPFCSTSKLMVIGAVLQQSLAKPELLNKIIHYTQQEVVASGYAPITQQHQIQGMTISQLAQAALNYSDNLAMNLLIRQVGGIESVNYFARSIGDQKFNLTRLEPELNTAIPHDLRDTTTAQAMGQSLFKLSLGMSLPIQYRQLLQTWLKQNTTGKERIKAALPANWLIGDKTGSGAYGTTNDIAIIWSQQCPPLIISIYFTQDKPDAPINNQIIQEATGIILKEFSRQNTCLAKALNS